MGGAEGEALGELNCSFSLVGPNKLVTAASELLSRNALDHLKKACHAMTIEILSKQPGTKFGIAVDL